MDIPITGKDAQILTDRARKLEPKMLINLVIVFDRESIQDLEFRVAREPCMVNLPARPRDRAACMEALQTLHKAGVE